MKSKAYLILVVFVFTLIPLLAFSQETLTITTYYPSPYGSYRELTSHRMKIGTTYSGSGTTVSDNNLIVEGSVGIGTTSPGAKLEVNGQVKIVDGTQGANKVLTSDAAGLASWQPRGGDLSSSWVGDCVASPSGQCKCNNGEKIMLMIGNSAGVTGYCNVHNQGSSSVYGICDSGTVAGSWFSCFR